MEGASTEQCKKYLDNLSGKYFSSIGEECVKLSKWYEEKRTFILSNKNYSENNPREAKVLARDMKSVNSACHPSSLKSYEYLTKPLTKINALKELE